MKKSKTLIVLTAIIGNLIGGSSTLHAQPIECEQDDMGYAYIGTRRASTISPTVVLGAVAIAAVIAVAVSPNRSNKSHSHHSH